MLWLKRWNAHNFLTWKVLYVLYIFIHVRDWNSSQTMRWIARKFCTVVVHGSQRMNPCDFGSPVTFFCSATVNFKLVIFSEIPQLLWNRKQAEILLVPRGQILKTLVILWFLLKCHQQDKVLQDLRMVHHWSVIRSDQYLQLGTYMIRGLIYECAHSMNILVKCSVIIASRGMEELERPTSFKSPVWEHFGFPVKYNDEGKRLVDKTVTVCRHCGTRKPYDSGNTSSMATHLMRHHPGVSLTGVKTKAAQQAQPLITAAFTKLFICLVFYFLFCFFADPKNDPIRDSDPWNDPNRCTPNI